MAFENTKTWLVLPLVLLLLVAECRERCYYCVNGEAELQVPCLFIFGDSLSDSGNNNNIQTSAKCNYRPYGIDFPTGPTGRFTNGRAEVDIITQFLGFENFIPPYANISGSDILEEENHAAFIFNDKLKSLVDLFNGKFSANSKFIFINTTAKGDNNSQGFAVSKSACCPAGLHGQCIQNQMPCNNRNDYVFWDEFHPSEACNLVTALASYNYSDPTVNYPINIKDLVDQEIKMEWELKNDFISVTAQWHH